MIEVPTFVKGEPGFAAKLNLLGDAIRELQAGMEKAGEIPVGKPAAKAKATGGG